MKITRLRNSVVSLAAVMLGISSGYADDKGPPFSFAMPAPDTEVVRTIDNLTAWAEGEYAEHEGEELFAANRHDGEVIQATLDITKELTDLAGKAKAAGDDVRAQAYLHAAEATARYAAMMPHLLEDRLATEHRQ